MTVGADGVADLHGYGPISVSSAREVAARARSGRWPVVRVVRGFDDEAARSVADWAAEPGYRPPPSWPGWCAGGTAAAVSPAARPLRPGPTWTTPGPGPTARPIRRTWPSCAGVTTGSSRPPATGSNRSATAELRWTIPTGQVPHHQPTGLTSELHRFGRGPVWTAPGSLAADGIGRPGGGGDADGCGGTTANSGSGGPTSPAPASSAGSPTAGSVSPTPTPSPASTSQGVRLRPRHRR